MSDEQIAGTELLREIFQHLGASDKRKIAKKLMAEKNAFVGHVCAPIWLPVKKAKIEIWNKLCEPI